MPILSEGRALPAPSVAERTIPSVSTENCNAVTVLGEGPGRVLRVQGHLALCHIHLLAARPDIVDVREEVRFRFGQLDEREHFFDVVATFRGGSRVAFTVKPEIRLASGRFIAEMQEVAWWVKRKSFADSVRLLSDADINRTDLFNANTIIALRDPDPEADARARTVARQLRGAASIRDLIIETGLAERGYRALLRLVGAGELSPLRREPITSDTLVQWKGRPQ